MATPSGMLVINLNPVGMMLVSEESTIAAAVAHVLAMEGRFVVLDLTDTVNIDPYGAGEILLLSGHLSEADRHFSLVVRDGVVGNFLRKYGVVDIVKSRRGQDIPASSEKSRSQGVGASVASFRVAAQSW